MDPFILNIDHQPTGFTNITYDIGPTSRLNLVTLTENAHHTLATPPAELLGYTLAEIRPPVRKRHR